MKIDNVKTELNNNLRDTRDQFDDKLKDLDKYYEEAMEEMNNNVE